MQDSIHPRQLGPLSVIGRTLEVLRKVGGCLQSCHHHTFHFVPAGNLFSTGLSGRVIRALLQSSGPIESLLLKCEIHTSNADFEYFSTFDQA